MPPTPMHPFWTRVHELPEQSLNGNIWEDYHWCPGERWDQQYPQTVAETSYASCGDLSLAYQVFGDGPVELVYAGSFVSHVELF
jgi:hypothetical protein